MYFNASSFEGRPEKDILAFIKDEPYLRFTLNSNELTSEFSDQIPTAAVFFDLRDEAKKPVRFTFNPEFWAKLTYTEKCFIYVHEIFHVIFDHGAAGEEYFSYLPEKDRNYSVLNQGQDICINELSLREHFNSMSYTEMPTLSEGCFMETCFPGNKGEVAHGEDFIYYYEELMKRAKSKGGSGENPDSFDQVTIIGNPGNSAGENLDALKKVIGKIIEEAENEAGGDPSEALTPENYGEKREEANSSGAGGGQGYSQSKDDMSTQITMSNTKEVQSLEDGINLVRKYYSGRSTTYKVSHNWGRRNRRIGNFQTSVFIPNREECKKVTRQKIIIYADVSGSVAHLSERFMRLALDLDTNVFDFELIPWASRVGTLKISKDKKRVGFENTGGGTVIENVLNDYDARLRKGDKYDAVLVLTDGEYSYITSRDSDIYKNWYFFMTNGSVNKPKSASVIRLRGF